MKNHVVRVLNRTIMGLLASLAIAASALGAQRYSFQSVDPPFGQPGVDVNVQLVWINNAGLITAQFQAPPVPDPFENMHTAVFERGQWTVIDIPVALSNGGTNASNLGQVALTYKFADGVWHCATYYRGTFKLFRSIPGYSGGIMAQGINNLGQMAGTVIDGAGRSHGFVGTDRNFTIFDYPDPEATSVTPLMLNDRGVTVGTYALSDGSNHAFKLEDGEFVDVDPPGAALAWAAGVNNRGVIVGPYVNSTSDLLGFVREGTQSIDFRVPHAAFTLPSFINDRGQISGIYVESNFVTHGFVATPVVGG